MTKKLKWFAIQPLTGGMYLGAEEALGCPAEAILSFKGLNEYKLHKLTKEPIGCGNEKYLTNYLKSHNRMPDYYIFKDKTMFGDDVIDDVNLLTEDGEQTSVDYSDTDLVVAVPVCSGLSTATIAPSSTKNSKNCNMRFIAKYTLSTIKPKIFIMENAPALYTNTGAYMRDYFNELADKTNYAVVYIKTDTQLHNNCQRRPRTFVMFVRDKKRGCPELIFENKHIDVIPFFEEIDKHLNNEHFVEGYEFSRTVLKYYQEKWGDNWREEFIKYKSGIENIINRNDYDDFIKYVKNTIDNEKFLKSFIHQIEHVKYKVSIDKGFYCDTPMVLKGDHTPAAIFKTIPQLYHPKEDRFISYEEALSLMGMPYDFTMKPCWNSHAIGQNVPVKTAKWVTENAVNIINNWNEPRKFDCNVLYANNIKQTYKCA